MSPPTAQGDSGALVLTTQGNHPIGMVIAQNTENNSTYIVPLQTIVNDMHLTNFGTFTSEVHDVEENQEDPDRAKINLDGAAAEAAIANHPEISKIPHVIGTVAIEEVLDEHQRYAGLQFVVYVDDERNVKAVRGAVPKYLEGFPVVVMAVPRLKDW
jgi:hypothetical protein